MVQKGDMVELMCNYHVEGDAELYSLKWYRDNVEFYRFIPSGSNVGYSESGFHSFHFQKILTLPSS